jgi:hypothetical protein
MMTIGFGFGSAHTMNLIDGFQSSRGKSQAIRLVTSAATIFEIAFRVAAL